MNDNISQEVKNFSKDLHLPRAGDSLFLEIQKEAKYTASNS